MNYNWRSSIIYRETQVWTKPALAKLWNLWNCVSAQAIEGAYSAILARALRRSLAYSLQLSLYATSLSVHTGVMCNGTKEFLVLPLFGSRHHLPHVPAGARSRTFSCTIPRVVLRRCMCSFAVALKASLMTRECTQTKQYPHCKKEKKLGPNGESHRRHMRRCKNKVSCPKCGQKRQAFVLLATYFLWKRWSEMDR